VRPLIAKVELLNCALGAYYAHSSILTEVSLFGNGLLCNA